MYDILHFINVKYTVYFSTVKFSLNAAKTLHDIHKSSTVSMDEFIINIGTIIAPGTANWYRGNSIQFNSIQLTRCIESYSVLISRRKHIKMPTIGGRICMYITL